MSAVHERPGNAFNIEATSAEGDTEVVRFDKFVLDRGRGQLMCCGAAVPLRPKAFELLSYFAERPGKVVSRDKLLEAIWPRLVVTPDSLTQCISELRAALHDPDRKLIKTVSRRGYLFDPQPFTAANGSAQSLAPISPVGRPGLLGTKDELHRECWPGVVVSENTLTQVITELRQALGDSPRAPRIIETVHGRGFRFVADARSPTDGMGGPTSGAEDSASVSLLGEITRAFVGRQAELARLVECLGRSGQGTRQLAFITGEAGIGKTTLSKQFLRAAALRDPAICILHGQCIQQHGPREPYMPVLEAFERLLRSSRGSTLIPLLRRVAPCWYVQFPWLLAGDEPAFNSTTISAAPQRMLREAGAFLESMASQSTVVLLLEDLHWSDHATTDLLSFLAERHDPARLLIIATFRPAEASMQEHPIGAVRRTLRSHGRSVDLALPYLSAADLGAYIHRRFGDLNSGLASLIHERTDGNPLFVVAIVEELIRQGQLTNTERGWVLNAAVDRADLVMPDDITEMIIVQFQGLESDERAALEAASVVGVTFAPWTVARALGADVEVIEAIAQKLVRSHLFLTVADRVDDDHASARMYRFSHAVHHRVIYEHVIDGARRRLHQAVGEALESNGGERLAAIAPELSVHFERSHDYARAIKYLALCIRSAQQCFAHREAVAYAKKALDLLAPLPEAPDRRRTELDIRMLKGISLNVTQGYLSEAVSENYARARTLCEEVGDARQLFEVVHTVWYPQLTATDEMQARRSVDELVRLAERLDAVEFELRADLARGRTELWNGHFGVAVRVLTQVLERAERDGVEFDVNVYGIHPMVSILAQGSIALWFHGFPDQARARAERALAYAERRGQPFDVASALCSLAFVQLIARNADEVLSMAARAAAVCRDKDVAFFAPTSELFAAAARVERGDLEGGLSDMERSLPEHQAVMGPYLSDVALVAIANALGRSGKWDDGLRRIHEGIAMTETNLERVYAAELWRVKGELILGKARCSRHGMGAVYQRAADAAERCFRRALEIAHQQEAASLALRAAMSLTRLFQERDGSNEAHDLLRSVYASFTEGFRTKDLEETEALLRTPGG